ncbi:MAG TPA: class I SAM-dependent methyltransferase [Methanoregula sp.]|nr:class I SAM-dependent methyltransferase [Methanoregula sp.]
MAADLEEHLITIRKNERDDFRWLNLRKIIKKNIAGHMILDAGCGTGHLTIELLKEGYEVTAIDSSPELIHLLRETVKSENLRLPSFIMDICNPHDLTVEKFDTIVCLDVIEHIEGDESVLNIFRDLLKNEGTLILSVPAIKNFFGERDKNVGHYRRYDKNEITNKVHKAGFDISDIHFWNFIGVIPYFVSEKLFHKPLNEGIRYSESGKSSKIINMLLNFWFSIFENRVRPPIGLTLIVVCRKKMMA